MCQYPEAPGEPQKHSLWLSFTAEMGTAMFPCAYWLLFSLDHADGSQLNTLTGAFHPLPAAPSAWERAGSEASTPCVLKHSLDSEAGCVAGRHRLGSGETGADSPWTVGLAVWLTALCDK